MFRVPSSQVCTFVIKLLLALVYVAAERVQAFTKRHLDNCVGSRVNVLKFGELMYMLIVLPSNCVCLEKIQTWHLKA